MKFRVEHDTLADAVAWVARALPTRPVVPILSSMRLDAEEDGLTMSCFDYELSATAHLPASIPPKLLLAGYLPSEMAAERIAAGTPVAIGGRARLPDGPGLGIEVDEAALGDPLLTSA